MTKGELEEQVFSLKGANDKLMKELAELKQTPKEPSQKEAFRISMEKFFGRPQFRGLPYLQAILGEIRRITR